VPFTVGIFETDARTKSRTTERPTVRTANVETFKAPDSEIAAPSAGVKRRATLTTST
jgi:hypothetical protein